MINNTNPAAELGLALERASAVLSTLATCYDGKENRFVVNEEFVVQAIASIETFVGQAKKSLDAMSDSQLQSQTSADISTSFEMINSPKSNGTIAEQAEGFSIGFVEEPVELATSYEELMRKVTAAEVFAVEGQSNQHSQANAALVPLLKSLRNDLQKLRVA